MDVWVEVKACLFIAYSNKKFDVGKMHKFSMKNMLGNFRPFINDKNWKCIKHLNLKLSN
jgi:hypothetical protein